MCTENMREQSRFLLKTTSQHIMILELQVVEGFKKNEEQLKHYVAEYKTKLKNQDQVRECHPQSRTLGFVDLSLILDSKLFGNSHQTFSGTIC